MEKETVKLNLINYFDVWGNKKEGYEINNLCKEGEIELPKEYTNKDILKALKEFGFLKKHVRSNMLIFEDLGEMTEIYDTNYKPICRVELQYWWEGN